MKNENEGGPAFPLCRTEPDGRNDCLHTGMSLRDWFAGMIAPAFVASISAEDIKRRTSDELRERVAVGSYLVADALLRERNKS